MAIGTVVVAGRTYQVTGLQLRNGELQITAHGWGPSPEVRDAPATVFGEDGQGVCQSWHISIPGLARNQDVTLTLPIRITHMDAPDGECEIFWKLAVLPGQQMIGS